MTNALACGIIKKKKKEVQIMISLFKKGINNLSPRRFGAMTETMMQNMLHLANSHNIAYDKIKDKNRIEIKFSRAYKPLMDVKNNFKNVNKALMEGKIIPVKNAYFMILIAIFNK